MSSAYRRGRRSRCVFTAVSCATSSSSGNVSLSRSSTRVATCSFDARGKAGVMVDAGNSRHARARAQKRVAARENPSSRSARDAPREACAARPLATRTPPRPQRSSEGGVAVVSPRERE